MNRRERAGKEINRIVKTKIKGMPPCDIAAVRMLVHAHLQLACAKCNRPLRVRGVEDQDVVTQISFIRVQPCGWCGGWKGRRKR